VTKGDKLGSEGAYRFQRGQVELCNLDQGARDRATDPLRGRISLAGVADGKHNLGALAGEFAGGDLPETGARSGDHDTSTRLVGELVGIHPLMSCPPVEAVVGSVQELRRPLRGQLERDLLRAL